MTAHPKNPLKQALTSGTPTSGAWLHLCNSMAAEMLSIIGFDWLLIDMEHGYGDYQTLLTQLHALQAGKAVSLVRVQWNDAAVIKRVLDMGAQGIMIPCVSNKQECEAAVAACKYPPQGIRGIGPIRAARYGQTLDYLARANDEIIVIAQIETKESVDNIEEIVQVPGVDVVFIGPNDLAASLGHFNDIKHPNVSAAITKIETAAKRNKIPLATISHNWEDAKALYQRGYQMVTLCSDVSLLSSGATTLLKNFQQM